MRLKREVEKSIACYPALYRVVNNPAMSRLQVLDHFFLGYGTEMEWLKGPHGVPGQVRQGAGLEALGHH
jgi:hypothetical protein